MAATRPLGAALVALLVTVNCLVAKVHFEQPVPTRTVSSVLGGTVELPCDTNPATADDRILLVLWYKEGLETPVYSYDVRRHSVRDGRHWWDAGVVGSRAHLRLVPASLASASVDGASLLTLTDVRESDEGSYRCRVDFKMSPTRNAVVNLTVVVPPKTLTIVDNAAGEVKSAAGPYTEGAALVLHCQAAGGRPPARVTWWRHNRLIDATFESILEGTVTNTLRLYNLTRDDLGVTLTCQAANNNITVPISTSVTIDMKLRPLTVKMSREYEVLSADRKYEVTCTSSGARPSPLITWWKGTTRLQSAKQTISADRNTTISTLSYVPLMDDDGKYLTCRVEHELLLERNLEESWKLTIHYVPIAHLEFGRSTSADNIKEGDDVFFDCNVKASPWITRIMWRHNGKQIHANTTQDVVLHNQTLIVQRVDRRWSGLITCVASNDEGDAESNALPLHIRFAPVCKSGQASKLFAGRGETLSVACEVEAHPADLVFHWTFNGSRDFVDLPPANYVVDRLRSTLSYTPLTEEDYGTIMCWARNIAGEQRDPCLYQILPAGRPDPVVNCSVANQTTDSLHVACVPGYDGGLPQYFLVQTTEETSGRVAGNRTSHVASFTVRVLEPGRSYIVTVWAVNQKGRSEPLILHAATLRAPEKEKRTEPVVASNAVAPVSSTPDPTAPVPVQMTPVLGTLIGVGAALIFAAAIIVVVMRVRSHAHRGRGERQNAFDKAAVPLNVEPDDSFDLKDTKTNKDPRSSGQEDTRDEDEKAFDRILSMSTTRRLLTSPTVATAAAATAATYAELTLPRNGSVRLTPLEPESTVYAQIDHGYIRLPPVDQFVANDSEATRNAPVEEVAWNETTRNESAGTISSLGTTRL